MKLKTALHLRQSKYALICWAATMCTLAGAVLALLPLFGVHWLALIDSRPVEVLLGLLMAITGPYALLYANHARFAAQRELVDMALASEDAAAARKAK